MILHKKFMFWNDWRFESIRGLKRVMNKPVKSSDNPIFDKSIIGYPKGGYCWPTIIYDKEAKIFKMWYGTLDAPLRRIKDGTFGGVTFQYKMGTSPGYQLAYATSSDGLTWEKPSLGIVEYKGSKENNLLNSVEREQGCVYLDENDPNPERKYKMTYQALEERDGRMQGRTSLAVSKDGLHWNREAYSNDILPFTSDSPNYILYDKLIHKYIVFPRPGHLDRRVAICLSKDCENWDGPYVVIEPKDIQNHFYYMCPMQYEGMYIGFIPVFKPQAYELDLACKMAGPVDTELCYSPNGIGWERIQVGEAFLPHGELGEWDAGGAYPMSAIEVGKEIRLYYIGMFREHGCFLKENRGHELGVATLRRDGFISLDATEEEGSVTTRLISFWPPAEDSLKQLGWLQWIDWEKGELRVNVKTDEGGYLKAELLDDHWHIIEGYSRRESIPIAGDHIDTVVRWKQKDVIKPLNMLFRVRLIIKNAKLYSLSFG